MSFYKMSSWGAWVAQLVKYLALIFGLHHGLTVHKTKPHIRLHMDNAEPAWDSLSLSPPAPLKNVFLLPTMSNTGKKKNPVLKI